MAQNGAELKQTEAAAREALAAAADAREVQTARARFLGRKGGVTALLHSIGKLPKAERAAAGAAINRLKRELEQAFDARQKELQQSAQAQNLAAHRLDVTLPGAAPPHGHLHPVTIIERDMCDFFRGLGYSIEEGPEVESDWHNFGALNFPEDHPARDLQDTFFLEGGARVMRTHTSPVQIRAMQRLQPPFRFIAPGRVYRHDLSATHYPMFHQLEGFCVGEAVSLGDLKGTLYAFARHLFGPQTRLRFRANFFPFTEPSAEMDVSWGEGWLEWGGCGMIHPRVLQNCGINPDAWQGFAFGMGLDRAAMIRFGIPRIHQLFDADVRVLEQF